MKQFFTWLRNKISSSNHLKMVQFVYPTGTQWESAYKRVLPRALKSAGYFIQQEVKSMTTNSHDFAWIQSTLLSPAFQHLCFRYKNNVYSILIGLQKGETLFVRTQDMTNQKNVCLKNNMIPCVIPLDEETLKPVLSGSHMFNTQTFEQVSIEEGDVTEMSQWELMDFAIQMVKNHITQQGCKLMSYCNVPEIVPQLWFEDKLGQASYVIVKPYMSADDSEFQISKQFIQQFSKYKGYYAGVSFYSGDAMQIMRNRPTFCKFKGLDTIEEKIKEGKIVDAPMYTVSDTLSNKGNKITPDQQRFTSKISVESPLDDMTMDGALGFRIYDDEDRVIKSFDSKGVLWSPAVYGLQKDAGLPFYVKTRIPSLVGVHPVEFCFDKKKLVEIIFNYNIRPQDVDDSYAELSYKLKKKFGDPSSIEKDKQTWNDHIRITKWQKESGERGIYIRIADTFNY